MHDGVPLVAPAITSGEDAAAGPGTTPPCKRLTSAALLAGKSEVEIEHGASIYRLRITSLGKLILTK